MIIQTTAEELGTDRFWIEHIDPIARAHGLPEPVQLTVDAGDPGSHLLLGPDGRILAIVRTDRPACPRCGR